MDKGDPIPPPEKGKSIQIDNTPTLVDEGTCAKTQDREIIRETPLGSLIEIETPVILADFDNLQEANFCSSLEFESHPRILTRRNCKSHFIKKDLESKGGDNPNQGSMEEFGSCLLDCGLLDAGYEGNDFTWTNGKVLRRLDMIAFNLEWSDLFSLTWVKHLNRVGSHHCSLLLQCSQAVQTFPSSFSIQNDDGSVLNDVVEIKRSAVEYFSTLLTKDNAINVDANDDLVGAVVDFFNGGAIPKGASSTTIVLIPKVSHPKTWSEFRPISLRIEDNILLAQELVQSIDEKTRGSNVILKLDMMKAYDMIDWDFIIKIMRKFGFCSKMTDMIENCISNCWFSVLFNGEITGYFHGSRGLRQGDPISPTLFIIAAECLSRGLYNMFQKYPSLHYLARCLLNMSSVRAKKVNSSKSGFILSTRASLSRASIVGGALGFPRIRLPTKYLGMPLYKGPKKSFLWDDLTSRIAVRMKGWEAKVLSPGGRITILKSILTSMPLYLLHVIVPPKSVMCRIERLFNKLLWSAKGQRRIHWECWEDLCYPVEEGVLGMRRLQDLVNAMSGASVHDSPIWKRLSMAGRVCNDLIRWKVGCGKINFWHDIWVDDSALSRYSPPIGESHLPVSFYWRSNAWYLDQVRSKIPNDIINSLYLIDVCSARVDHPLWSLTAHGGFTMYSAWNRVHQVSDSGVSPVWNFFDAMFSVSLFVDGSIRHWLSAWFFSGDYISAGHIRIILPLFVLWFIWLERNDAKYRNTSFYPDRIRWKYQGKIFQLFQAGLLKRSHWKGDMKLESLFGCHYVLEQVYSPKIVRWIKPKEHCFKLNVDGSFQGNNVVAGGVGILPKSALHAEILTLYHGLTICKDRGIGRLWIEMDALSVINLVQNYCIGSWDAADLHIGSSLADFPSLRGLLWFAGGCGGVR
uniref:Reverse transcriptase domain-containing protein n=1 Tax=Salix viminalis TaxID=40686 RepID=A0A6N2MJJ3_SALVM